MQPNINGLSYDEIAKLPNFLDYYDLVKAFIRIKDYRDPLDIQLMAKYDGYYTLIPSESPEVLFEDVLELFKMTVVKFGIKREHPMLGTWDCVHLNLR